LLVRLKTKNEAIGYFIKAVAARKFFKSLDTLSYRNFIITDANLKKLTETGKISEYLNYFKIKYIETNTDVNSSTAAPIAYTGPYKQDVSGIQSFALIVPKEEANADQLAASINQFNLKNYAQLSLKLSSGMLDDFRIYVKVEGFQNMQSGLEYLRSIAKDQSVYGPIQNASYRNFIITPENELIFKQSKNILTYMEFYKKFYLKQ